MGIVRAYWPHLVLAAWYLAVAAGLAAVQGCVEEKALDCGTVAGVTCVGTTPQCRVLLDDRRRVTVWRLVIAGDRVCMRRGFTGPIWYVE